MRSIEPVKTNGEVENGEGREVIEKTSTVTHARRIKEAAEEGA
jgi:hypothetical protein